MTVYVDLSVCLYLCVASSSSPSSTSSSSSNLGWALPAQNIIAQKCLTSLPRRGARHGRIAKAAPGWPVVAPPWPYHHGRIALAASPWPHRPGRVALLAPPWLCRLAGLAASLWPHCPDRIAQGGAGCVALTAPSWPHRPDRTVLAMEHRLQGY